MALILTWLTIDPVLSYHAGPIPNEYYLVPSIQKMLFLPSEP